MAEQKSHINSAYAWYVVVILLLAQALSYVDRQILSLMVAPIRKDLGLSDTELSLLQGFAFVLFYTFLGIPLGWVADRRSRKNLIGTGLGIWGLATALCGLAGTFSQLFGARVLVGVGEASLSPAAYSIIADYFTHEKRARALSLYSTGVSVGAGLAAILGGAAIAFAGEVANWFAVYGLHFRNWQIVFFLVGAPAAILLPFVFALREPERLERGEVSGDAWADFKAGLGVIAKKRGVYVPVILGLSMTALVNYASLAWVPSYFIRVFQWTAPEIGFAFGMTVVGTGICGSMTAGFLSDWLVIRGKREGPVVVMMWAAILAILPAVAFSFLKNDLAALAAIGVMLFFITFPIGLAPAILQAVTPNELRAQVSALYIFVVVFIALGLGPTIVAATSDYFFRDEMMIGRALAIVSWVVLPCAVVLLAIARPRAREMLLQRPN
ncbi:MAG TPA: MFS transporter [Alphaproteobacteria bacterium]|nr:MFS transporter [Alphaproteobacteria bacterium]